MKKNSLSLFLVLTLCLFPSLGRSYGPSQRVSKPVTEGENLFKGKILETMNAGNYTYVKVQGKNETIWAASSEVSVSVGQEVELIQGMPMKDFHSKTLNRTFPIIYFTPFLSYEGKGEKEKLTIAPNAFKKAQYNVSEIHAKKNELEGKKISIRGKVVKVNLDVLGLNWVHIQDGSGEKATSDLTVTTKEVANIGDVVLVGGKVFKDKDFGHGYKYAVIIQEANLTKE